MLRATRLPLALTAVILIAVGIISDVGTAVIVGTLAVLEISLSFDNAVVNAVILRRLNPFWQQMFLTVGIAIAVFGMRLVFPLLVVVLSAKLGPTKVVDLAINHPHEYSQKLAAAHPAIAAFGGIFILMVALDFFFEEREIKWLVPIETQLAKIGKLDQASVIFALLALLGLIYTFGSHHKEQVLLAGVAGLATYLVVNSIGALFEADEAELDEEDSARGASPTLLAGKAAFASFLYLEVLDASFSFDNVTGAFAISDKIFVIATGLGIGALFIRSMTVYMVRERTLETFVYLEHGAGYAIGTLSVLLFVTIRYHVQDLITGLIGAAFITAAFTSSVVRKRRLETDPKDGPRGSRRLA
jgi:hypothetical protein